MENFHFRARKHDGESVQGTINAANEAAVAAYIRGKGMVVTQIKRVKGEGDNTQYFSTLGKLFAPKITLHDTSIFCRQFATLMSAGVSLVAALDILAEQTENKRFKQIITDIGIEVHKGTALSAAMGMYPKVFSELMINMIAAGEAGGMLETVLGRLADQYEKEYRLVAKIKSAMTYPAIVVCATFLIVGGMITFVLPTFIALFEAMNLALPWPTRVVLGISAYLQKPWFDLLLLVGAVVAYYAYKTAYAANHDFRLYMDRLLLRLPVFGVLYNKLIISRFASTFASLSRSGVPIMTALAVVSKATGSLQAETVLSEARKNISRGRGLSEPMEKSGLFPPLVVNMVSIGEESGSLDFMLDKIAEFYTAEVEDMVGRLESLLEPMLILFLGVMVGFIAVAMLMPMFDVITKVGQV